MINKELNIPENEFINQVSNDIIGDNFIDQLEYSMMLIQFKFKQMHLREYNEYITRNTFDKAYILHNELDSNLNFFEPFTDLQATPEIIPNLNIRTWNFGETISLSKVKEMSPQEKRGLKIKKKYAFKLSTAFYNKSTDSFYGATQGLEVNPSFFDINIHKRDLEDKFYVSELPQPISLNPNIVLCDNPLKYIPKEIMGFYMNQLSMSYQVALSLYYEWTLYIKEYDNIGIVVPINPIILKELYNSSIMNFEDKKRMIHFVKDHYRRKVAIPSEDYSIYVKKYLRGENKFNYRGFKTEIIPPKYDLNRINTRKKFTDTLC